MKRLGIMKKYLPAGTLGLSLLLHLLIFLCISGIVLIQAVPSKQPFAADTGATQSPDLPPPPELPDEAEPEPFFDAPAAADEDTPPALANIPMEQIASNVVNSFSFNLPPQIGISTGSIEGKGAGGVPGGTGRGGRSGPPRAVNPFGERNITDSTALIGYMYDLKQTAARKPSKFAADTARQDFLDFVKRFVSGGCNPALLSPYYKVQQPIGNYQIFIPKMNADEAPKAFNAERYVAPKRWLILYTGTFIAPVSGTFRFVGLADDVLVVRLNGRTVQDGSLMPASGVRREILGRPYVIEHPFYQMYAGEWFELEKDKAYPLEILVGENPGGQFAAYLQIQQKGVEYPQKKGFAPALPVFQLRPTIVPRSSGNTPPVAADPFVAQ
jgi:hypothetical protein